MAFWKIKNWKNIITFHNFTYFLAKLSSNFVPGIRKIKMTSTEIDVFFFSFSSYLFTEKERKKSLKKKKSLMKNPDDDFLEILISYYITHIS